MATKKAASKVAPVIQRVSVKDAVVPVGYVVDENGRMYNMGQKVPIGTGIAEFWATPQGSISTATWPTEKDQVKAIKRALFVTPKKDGE